jgi:RES domain-containing protein
MAKCAARSNSWSGEVYRSASPRYANKDDLLTGAGSKTAGGRWNPPNSFRTIYTSLDPHTALDEVLAHFVYYRLPIARAMPRVIVALETCFQRILNLTNSAIRRLLGVSERRLRDEPWRTMQKKGREALTQALGRLAFDAGWEGILVSSAASKNGVNLIIFPANLDAPGSWLQIMRKDDLPRRP